MKSIRFIFSLISIFLLTSCGNTGSVLPSASGRSGDLLFVIDDELWNSAAGDSLKNLFEQDIVGLPWDETFFDVSRVNQQNFNNVLSTARSIIDVEVNRTYTQAKVRYQKELYSRTQRYIKVQLPDVASFQEVLEKEGHRMLSYLYQGERERFLINYKKFNDIALSQRVLDSTGVKMIIPKEYSRQKFNKDFVWMLARSNNVLQYIAIYWYDYTSQDQLTKEALVAKRDSVMKKNIPGDVEGSYMSTGEFYPVVLKQFKRNDEYVAEMRGIWETKGDMMGGPFVSQTRIDVDNNKLITVEAFIYAPNRNKRNYMRQMEALLYTIKIPQKDKEQSEAGTQL